MSIFKTGTIFVVMFLVTFSVTILFLSKQTETERHGSEKAVAFTVESGEGLWSLANRLKKSDLINRAWVFVFYTIRTDTYRSLQAGNYSFRGPMTIPEIAETIAAGKVVPPGVRITFPEGWTMRQMAMRLTEQKLPGAEFLTIASTPFPKWRERFPFLSDVPVGVSLEGYLFPDTYIFPEQATGELIVNTLLQNFQKKVTTEMITAAKQKNLSPHELMTLSSIVESEVRVVEDRKMVADIFLRRLAIGQALQSDATLRYVLRDNKIQYSIEETKTVSPYNTYANAGLPPGPIGNPGLQAIDAVLHPTPNPYFFFLNNPTTGETVFATTFEEHVENKANNGL